MPVLSDNLNYLAIELIQRLGNDKPTQQQIDLVEFILAHVDNKVKLPTLLYLSQ